jgi:FKBP-type peptidyl-prolyl cis-trans isomerase FklB
MKLLSIALLTSSLAVTSAFAQAPSAADAKASAKPAATKEAAAASTKLTSKTDRLSYTIGVDLGANFKRQGVNVNPDVFLQGFKDAQSGGKLLLNKQEMIKTLQSFQQELIAKREARFKAAAEKNLKTGKDFLSVNKAKDGVVVLPSGLQYKVISEGKGNKPKVNDVVKVDYTGRLISGKVFDSTEKSGKPATFKVNEVIPGWTEALQKMPVGSVWEVFVPSKLAYGARGIGGPIGPNETLIFKIHLLAIKAAKESKKAPAAAPASKSESKS